MTQSHHELAVEAVKASPPVTVAGLSLGGVSLQDWVYVLTGVYILLQMILLVYDRLMRKDRDDNREH